ncbi:hypothetical protein CcBV_32.4 [Bracoviriform congregatae]|uniref:Uncharacterized protein n=1 Tax=Bracoviriform congregatae TaxID=39640 RepID=Q5ZNU4_9VIRU|nr:hypothetical protein CcBV_32.4 [Bracoviriform congregatae]CAG18435.1 hypothetical protein CcBV_32.4 [Bracoviriform congregatae]
MEEVFAKIAFVELAPNIIVPYEWPVDRIYNVVLRSAEEVIMQNTHEDLILQVDGIPARLYRNVKKHRFYHVFKKISKEVGQLNLDERVFHVLGRCFQTETN